MLATRMRMAAAGVTGTPAAGWWVVAGKTCLAAYQPIGAASLAASYTNLANPGTYDAAPGNAPTWASGTGWEFTGASSQYLTTGVVPNGGNYSMAIRYTDAAAGTYSLAGSYASGTTDFEILPRYVNAFVYYANGGGVTVSPGLAAGVLALAGRYGYRDGTVNTSALGAWSGTSVYAIVIGAANAAGTISRFQTCKIQALAIYSDTLSGAEVATLSAAMAAL